MAYSLHAWNANMARFVSLWVLFLGLVSSISAQDACDISEFVSCMEPIHNATFGHEHGLLQGSSDLEETCPILRQGETCVKNYAERCGTEMIAEDFHEQFEKPALLIREICNRRSPLRGEYLQVVSCLRQHIDDLEACSSRAEEFLSNHEADTDEKEKR
uniref:Cysteine proteinase cathepsin L n=1 Tax=Cyriopagopus schmidti TaxID=29017 RepID=B5M6E0_CYRSC|nr:cysteine proteinase cathepsin L [Cyriopagopus schmidti]